MNDKKLLIMYILERNWKSGTIKYIRKCDKKTKYAKFCTEYDQKNYWVSKEYFGKKLAKIFLLLHDFHTFMKMTLI